MSCFGSDLDIVRSKNAVEASKVVVEEVGPVALLVREEYG